MTSAQRILANTAAQYVRTIVNVCLSLYSTRLILAALGQTDFGIYSVVAGIVAMLSFSTNALVSTTQRYLSFNHGKGDNEKIYQVFGNSMLLHEIIGLGMLIILGILAYPIIYSVLHIESGREIAAIIVYASASLMLFLSFLTAPFRALFIARESIIYISIIDVLDGIFKLIIAIILFCLSAYDKLIIYALLLIGIALFNLLAFAIYALYHFEECHIPSWREWNSHYVKELSGFAGWTIYSTGCIIARTQGIAIIINRVFGSAINAAYGIAQQVSGAVSFISQAILNAMSPQIVKAEGNENRAKMLNLSELASKYATLLMAMIVIPLVFEMPAILNLWLNEVPDNTVMFCRYVLIASVCDQFTIGLGIANQAIGKIRNYSLTINTIKVLSLPAAWFCIHIGYKVEATMYCYLAAEIICAIARLPFLRYTAGLSISHFVKNVFLRSFFTIATISIVCFFISRVSIPFRLIFTIIISITIGSIVMWFTALTSNERQTIMDIVQHKKIHR